MIRLLGLLIGVAFDRRRLRWRRRDEPRAGRVPSPHRPTTAWSASTDAPTTASSPSSSATRPRSGRPGNDEFGNGRVWIYFPEDRYAEARAIVADAVAANECQRVAPQRVLQRRGDGGIARVQR